MCAARVAQGVGVHRKRDAGYTPGIGHYPAQRPGAERRSAFRLENVFAGFVLALDSAQQP